jgi:hypothetical protein
MGPIYVALFLVLVIGIGVGIYAIAAPRRRASSEPSRAHAPLHVSTDWTSAAGEEFANLTEPARCDMIFAVAALEDDRSKQLLEYALDDPSEAVALAAAHALVGRGESEPVQRHLHAHPGERSERIAQALSLLAPEG